MGGKRDPLSSFFLIFSIIAKVRVLTFLGNKQEINSSVHPESFLSIHLC
jgi:hypothetical protein